MLEIFGIMMLCKANRKLALARGRRPGGYVALTIILWVGMELLGFVIAGVLDLDYGMIPFGYGFAGLGALISFLCAKFAPKGDYVDPASVNYPSVDYSNIPLDQPAYAPYLNQNANNQPVDQFGMPVASKVNEYGMPVDDQGNYSPVLNQYGVPADTNPFVPQQPAQSPFVPAGAVPQKPNFCGFCGAKLVPGSKFCDSCGARIGE